MSHIVRDSFLDTVKIISIFMVVFVHTLADLGVGYRADAIYCFMQLVTMPIFLFISGYFLSLHKPSMMIGKRALEFFFTYCIFSVVWMVIRQNYSLSAIVIPAKTLWFLLSFPCWILITKWMVKYMNVEKIFLISVLGGVLFGFVPVGKELSLQRTFAFYPFFVTGLCIRNSDLINKIKNFNLFFSITFLIITFTAFIVLKMDMRWLFCANVPYIKWDVPLVYAPFVRFIWYLWATVALVSFFRVINLAPNITLLSAQGAKTLTVYLYHYFPIHIMDKAVHFSTRNLIILFLIAIAIVILTLFLHELRFIRYSTMPLHINEIITQNK